MRNILVRKFFGFAKIVRFSFFPPPASVQLYYLSYVTSSGSNEVTCQSEDVELFLNIHDSK